MKILSKKKKEEEEEERKKAAGFKHTAARFPLAE